MTQAVFPHLKRARLFHKFCSAATASRFYVAGIGVCAGTWGVTYLIGDSVIDELKAAFNGQMGVLEAVIKTPIYGGVWAANWGVAIASSIVAVTGINRHRRNKARRMLVLPPPTI